MTPDNQPQGSNGFPTNSQPPSASPPVDFQSTLYAQPSPPPQSYHSQTEQSAVWPPPVYAEMQAALIFYPFTFLYERVEGSVSDFRSGQFAIDRGGIIVNGKVQPPAEIYQTILMVTLLLRGLIIIAYLIMRYGCLKNEQLAIPWNEVKSVTLAPNKRKLCVAYSAPNYKGIIKTFSLTMQFKKADFDMIVGTLDTYAPGLAQPGKIKGANSPVVIVWASCLFAILIGVLAMEIAGYH